MKLLLIQYWKNYYGFFYFSICLRQW